MSRGYHRLKYKGGLTGFAIKKGRWNVTVCPKTKKRIGYWSYGSKDHSEDICPRCGGRHFA